MNKPNKQEVIKRLLSLALSFPSKKGKGHIRVRLRSNGEFAYQMIYEVWKSGKRFRKAKTFSTREEAVTWQKEYKESLNL